MPLEAVALISGGSNFNDIAHHKPIRAGKTLGTKVSG
jgi:hypothetical protein